MKLLKERESLLPRLMRWGAGAKIGAAIGAMAGLWLYWRSPELPLLVGALGLPVLTTPIGMALEDLYKGLTRPIYDLLAKSRDRRAWAERVRQRMQYYVALQVNADESRIRMSKAILQLLLMLLRLTPESKQAMAVEAEIERVEQRYFKACADHAIAQIPTTSSPMLGAGNGVPHPHQPTPVVEIVAPGVGDEPPGQVPEIPKLGV